MLERDNEGLSMSFRNGVIAVCKLAIFALATNSKGFNSEAFEDEFNRLILSKDELLPEKAVAMTLVLLASVSRSGRNSDVLYQLANLIADYGGPSFREDVFALVSTGTTGDDPDAN